MQILENLERLAAACPWDVVRITLERKPCGEMQVTAAVNRNDDLGLEFDCAWGEDAETAVNKLITITEGKRDPTKTRERKILELKAQIEKLQAVVIGMPPYVPNRELAERVTQNAPIDIQAEAV